MYGDENISKITLLPRVFVLSYILHLPLFYSDHLGDVLVNQIPLFQTSVASSRGKACPLVSHMQRKAYLDYEQSAISQCVLQHLGHSSHRAYIDRPPASQVHCLHFLHAIRTPPASVWSCLYPTMCDEGLLSGKGLTFLWRTD